MASIAANKLQLSPGSWYGWQVLDGRSPVAPPWNASPIFIKSVKPLKTGRGELAVEFIPDGGIARVYKTGLSR